MRTNMNARIPEDIKYFHVIDLGLKEDYWFTVPAKDFDKAVKVCNESLDIWMTEVRVFDFYYDYGELLCDNLDGFGADYVDANWNPEVPEYCNPDFEIEVPDNPELRAKHDELENARYAEIKKEVEENNDFPNNVF